MFWLELKADLDCVSSVEDVEQRKKRVRTCLENWYDWVCSVKKWPDGTSQG